MNWRRAIFMAACLVLVAMTSFQATAWADATTSVTLQMAEEGLTDKSEAADETKNAEDAKRAPSAMPTTGDRWAAVSALLLTLCVFAIALLLLSRTEATARESEQGHRSHSIGNLE